MLEYLFDADYRRAKQRYDNAKEKRDKLSAIKDDMFNDSNSITTINTKLECITEEFAKAILDSDTYIRVYAKVNTIKEPYQANDGCFWGASNAIEDEMSLLKREMDRAQATMDSIKNQ